MDTIEREAALKAVHEAIAEGKSWYSALSHLPSAEKTGAWENIYSDNYKCSVCGAWYRSDEPLDFNYCPNCGSYNREVE